MAEENNELEKLLIDDSVTNFDDLYKHGLYYEGENPLLAFMYFKKATEVNKYLLRAWKKLAYFYQYGIKDKLEINKEKAIECYQKIIELDSEDAENFFSLGYCYEFCCEDGINAVECYRKTVELDDNYGPAWFRLGLCYANGTGTEVDEKKAFECYKKANELDDSTSLISLGRCYLHGIGTKIDLEKAKEFLDKAQELYPENEELKELLKEWENANNE